LLYFLGNFLDIMVFHFNEIMYRLVLAMWVIGPKQEVVAQALGIAQGTI